jgi:hypothetical protein
MALPRGVLVVEDVPITGDGLPLVQDRLHGNHYYSQRSVNPCLPLKTVASCHLPLPEQPDPDVNKILFIADNPRGVDQATGTDGRTAPAMSPVRQGNSTGKSSYGTSD